MEGKWKGGGEGGERGSGTTTIDDLPDALLFHILSFLPTIDAIRASAVSPRWRNLWHSIPFLHFDIVPFHSRFPNQPLHETRQLFAEFVCQTLLLRRPFSFPIQKFLLKFDYLDYDCHKFHVDSWIRYAINSKAMELDLDFKSLDEVKELDSEEDEGYDGDSYYTFHFADLINSCVEVLKLRGCDLLLPIRELPMSIPSLKSVHLIETEFSLCTKMVFSCDNLEYLFIRDSYNIEHLKIVSPKLKVLILSNFKATDTDKNSVEICAPNLRSVSFDSFCVGKYILQDKSSLVEAHLDFGSRSLWDFACWSNAVSSLTGVERLTIQNMWVWFEFEQTESMHNEDKELNKQSELGNDEYSIEENFFGKVPVAEDVFSESFAFNNLKHLILRTGYTKNDLLGLEFLLEICPGLESLFLEHVYTTGKNENLAGGMIDRQIILHMPNLRHVEMRSYRGTKNELYILRLLQEHKGILENIVVSPVKGAETE